MDVPAGWRPYPATKASTVVGTLLQSEVLPAGDLADRPLLAWLPASYPLGADRYPVLYRHDGQNLFDEVTSYAGVEWGVDETMQELAAEGIEAIVVGVRNAEDDRAAEYVPGSGPHGAGQADDYLSFLVDVAKPFVDGSLRTDPGRDATGLLGSSLGGVISLYGLFARPDVFGFAGAMSPAFWYPGGDVLPLVREAPFVDARIYLDAGTDEEPDEPDESAAYVRVYREALDLLRAKGYGDDRLMGVLEEGAIHHESAWASRLPAALLFLLG